MRGGGGGLAFTVLLAVRQSSSPSRSLSYLATMTFLTRLLPHTLPLCFPVSASLPLVSLFLGAYLLYSSQTLLYRFLSPPSLLSLNTPPVAMTLAGRVSLRLALMEGDEGDRYCSFH